MRMTGENGSKGENRKQVQKTRGEGCERGQLGHRESQQDTYQQLLFYVSIERPRH